MSDSDRDEADTAKDASCGPPFLAATCNACHNIHNDASWHSKGTFVRARRMGKGEGKHRQCPRVNGRPVDDRTTLCQSVVRRRRSTDSAYLRSIALIAF